MSRRKRAKPTPSATPHAPALPAEALATGGRPRLPRRWMIAAVLAVLAAAGLWWAQRDDRAHDAAVPPPAAATPPQVPADDPPRTATAEPVAVPITAAWVDNAQCLDCHAGQADAWRDSHHARAMAAPTAASVRGDFADAEFTHANVTSRFFTQGGRYFVRTDGPDGAPGDFEIAYTFGTWPLQQYLIELPGGRLQPLQVAWDDERNRWFHLLPHETTPPGDVLHWTGRYQTANTMCVTCHTTGFEKRYDAATETFDSRWTEPNVSCQSCHGPGEHHVAWARAVASATPAPEVAGTHLGLTVDPAALRGTRQVEICSGCHSRRSELTATAAPGEPRLDHYLPALLTEGLYHADGQQQDEVFVDGSFRQSRMYALGVTCTHCHDPHGGKLRLEGNAVCGQCHAAPGNPAFPTAAGAYDTPAHHFHEPGSTGAQCVNCHMPAKNYMQIQPRPDHSLRIPRPDLSVTLGTPNACNQCHDDQPAQWAADRIADWYGPARRQEPHYGEVLAAARAGARDAGAELARLAGDRQQPAIVRATALAALAAYPEVGMATRLAAVSDADAEIRAAAAESLETASPERRLAALAPLLRDPLRAVRIAAARVLAPIPPQQMTRVQRIDFNAALDEYAAAQAVALDMPGARLNLAVMYQNTGRPSLAEPEYRAALRIDPDFTPARANLAMLYNALARNAEAEQVLVEGLAREPGIGELQYSLGLLLAEENRLTEAADALAKAAELLPERARVHYNLGLTLQRLGRLEPAVAALHKAQSIDPNDPALPYALAIIYAQTGRTDAALEWAVAAAALAPDDAGVAELIAGLRSGG